MLLSDRALFVSAIVAAMVFLCSHSCEAQRPRILCLHGGGGSAAGFRDYDTRALRDALPEFEFVYVDGPYGAGTGSHLWIRDPPGGKGEPTIDPGWADEAIAVLDRTVRDRGPFYGILGFSQGAAFVPVYLASVPEGTFDVAIMFSGYLTTTHLGLLGSVEAASPFGDIPAIVWMGANDRVIPNAMSLEKASRFASPTIVTSPVAGHEVPGASDSTFGAVVNFVTSNYGDGYIPTASPVSSSPTATLGTPSPTDAASRGPTPMPTRQVTSADDDGMCSDSKSWKKYSEDKKRAKDCSWVGKRPKWRCRQYGWEPQIMKLVSADDACPLTCSHCKEDGEDDDKEEDNGWGWGWDWGWGWGKD